ncbi:MAG TPA: hypothetical protein VE619_01525 [Nitrososphaeraceae archaeon]|nr:hypothetical protein [Nitrososphaeraceae archaeon]
MISQTKVKFCLQSIINQIIAQDNNNNNNNKSSSSFYITTAGSISKKAL